MLDGPLAHPLGVDAIDAGDEEMELAVQADDARRPPSAFMLDRFAQPVIAGADSRVFPRDAVF